jgi:hypothetical protein
MTRLKNNFYFFILTLTLALPTAWSQDGGGGGSADESGPGGDGGGESGGDGGGGDGGSNADPTNDNSSDGGSNDANNSSDIFQPPALTEEMRAKARAEALLSARGQNSDYAKSNAGYRAGFDYFLEKNPPIEANGQISYSEEQINQAKENARRLAPVYEQKVDELLAKVKSEIAFDQQSAAFKASLQTNLARSSFNPVVTTDAEGKAALNVEIADGILKGALIRTVLDSVKAPEERERAEKALAESRARLQKAEARIQELKASAETDACEEIRARRDRQFLGTNRLPASLEIQNNTPSFK